MPPKTEISPTLEVSPASTLKEGGLPSMSIDMRDLDLGAATKMPKRKYWHGTLPSSPYQNSAAGGISFNRFDDPGRKDAAGKTNRVANLGEVSELNDHEVKRVLQGIANRVIRWNGATASVALRATVDRTLVEGKPEMIVTDAGYTAESGDRPFAEYVYFVRLPDSLPEGWRSTSPMSVAEASRRAAASSSAKKAS